MSFYFKFFFNNKFATMSFTKQKIDTKNTKNMFSKRSFAQYFFGHDCQDEISKTVTRIFLMGLSEFCFKS